MFAYYAQGFGNQLPVSYNKHGFIYNLDNSLVRNTRKYCFIKTQRLYLKH